MTLSSSRGSVHQAASHEIETYRGHYVDLSAPEPTTIAIDDVAHALANTCRFGGHTRVFYSVAEHAVRVADKLAAEGCGDWALAGLHHDDAEAYLGDIPRPLKPLLGDAYREMTGKVDRAIWWALGRRWHYRDLRSAEVEAADEWMLAVEALALLPSQGKGWNWGVIRWPVERMTLGLSPEQAEALYIRRHHELLGVCRAA